MNKAAIFAISVLIVVSSLLGCTAGLSTTSLTEQTTSVTSQYIIPSQDQLQRNHLELVSRGMTFQLIEHWVYSVQKGVSADGKWFDKLALEMDPTLKADLAAAKEIPYADDFSFRRVWPGGSEEMEKLSFNVYDEDLESIHDNIEKLDVPQDAGLYYIAVLVTYGDKNNHSGYQYIFKARRR